MRYIFFETEPLSLDRGGEVQRQRSKEIKTPKQTTVIRSRNERIFKRGRIGLIVLLLFITDFAGLVHCLDAKTGKPYWTCDVFYTCWTTPLIVGERVFVGDEGGDVAIFPLSSDPNKAVQNAKDKRSGAVHEPLHTIDMVNSIYTMPVVANNVLYIANKNELFAIAVGASGPRRHAKKDTGEAE